MYTSIKIKKNVRKLRIEQQPVPITEQTSKVLSPTVAAEDKEPLKMTTQNMPALDQNLPQSLRGLANQPVMHQSHHSFQPLTSLEGSIRQSAFLKSLKAESQQLSPQQMKGKGAARYNEYVTQGKVHTKLSIRPNDSLERQAQSKLAVGELRLKPSQIVQDAKNDVNFGGGRHVASDLNHREGSSLAVLLQSSQSQPVFQPAVKRQSTFIGNGTQTDSSQQQQKITAVINERFVYKENSRFKNNNSKSRIPSILDDLGKNVNNLTKMQMENVVSQNKEAVAVGNFQSLTSEHAQASNKIYKKYQKHFQSPLPSNFQVSQSQQQLQHVGTGKQHQHRRSINNNNMGGNLFNAHASVQSINSHGSMNAYQQQSSTLKPHQILSKQSDQPTTYIPFLKQAPFDAKGTKNIQEDEIPSGHMQAYPSQKIFATADLMSQHDDATFGDIKVQTGKRSSGQGTPDNKQFSSDKVRQSYMPYQVQLMSLANLSSHHDSARKSVDNKPNTVKQKQERIIQRLERKAKKDQVITTPGGSTMPNIVRKSRNPNGVHTVEAGGRNSFAATRQGSMGSTERQVRGSWDKNQQSGYKHRQPAETLGDLPDPVDQVKLLPLKARMIFKKAMKELDSVDLVNSEQLPMSRPRIRAILKQMKDNLEQGVYSDENFSNKLKSEKVPTPLNARQLQGYGKQAERDLFGMLIKEKKERKEHSDKNHEMRQLYEDRMLRKKQQYERMLVKAQNRQKIKDVNGYLSASSSDEQNSFQGEDNAVFTQRQQTDYATTLLSSERPSSAEHVFGSVTSRKNVEQYNKMRSLSTKRKKKQELMVLEELLSLIEKPSADAKPAAGNFYSKFQNIDKIIQNEDNQIAETTMQELHEQREIDQDLRVQRIHEGHQNGGSVKQSPIKASPLKYLSTNKFQQTGTQFIGSPLRTNPVPELGKSPIIEYLKQVQKDNLLPHFMPFKKLQEATMSNQDSNSGGIKYCLDQFSINARVAPSIASAIMNLQHLQSMSLINSMLSEESFMTLLNATPKTLVSLNLSQNEHLTPKCFIELHKLEHLEHLSLEKCNIRDETVALLFDLDPLKLNPELPAVLKGLMKKKSLKKILGTIVEDDETPQFLFSGLIKTLKLFNVSKNQISDAGAKIISTFIEKSVVLETLQLHWNKIRAKGAMCLAKAIKTNRTIKILDISFNSFGSGAVKKAIVQDDPKKQEEVAAEQRHAISKLECVVSAWKWRKTLMKNFTLLHLDISFNSFSDQDMIAIGDGLRENHTLLGCHVEGNSSKLDSLGFIVPIISNKKSSVTNKTRLRENKQVYDVHNYDRIPISMENTRLERPEPRQSVRQDKNSLIKNCPTSPVMQNFSKVDPRNCWLCEGWSQMLFEVRLPEKFIGCEVASVYLHLSFEDFNPMVMQEKIEAPTKEENKQKRAPHQRQSSKSKQLLSSQPNTTKAGLAPVFEGENEIRKPKAQVFQLFRMIPPCREGIQFYYSMQNPKNFRRETFIDQYKKKIFIEDEMRQKLVADEHDQSSSDDNGEPVLPFPKFVNQTRTIMQQNFDLTPEARLQLKAKPRCAFNTMELTRPKSPWSIPKSFFAKFKSDNDLIISKCFDWDWRCSTLDKMLKDPDEKELVIKFLRPKYGLIRETYKHLACVAPAGNMPSLGMNILTEIMLKCNEFVDYKNTKLSDVDLAFIATNAVGAKNFPFRQEVCINPERQIIRYQFFEILIRLAIERFTQKLKMSQSEGIKVFFEQYIQDIFQKYSSHPWRLDRYWNEDCDNVIKDNMDTLKDIYNAFAQAQSPGDPKIMRLTRLIELITQSGVCDDNFGAREIGPLYNLSMMTNMDEINKTRHMDMIFIEFVEALARIADKAVNHSTVEFPVDRSAQPGGSSAAKNSLLKKNQTNLNNSKMVSAMDSVMESNEISRAPSPSPNLVRGMSGQQNTVQSELTRRSEQSPSFPREDIGEPISRIITNSMQELSEDQARVQTPASLVKETNLNMDIQSDLKTPATKGGNEMLGPNGLSILTEEQAYNQKPSFNGPQKSPIIAGRISQSQTKKLNRSTSRPSQPNLRRKNSQSSGLVNRRSQNSAQRSNNSRSRSRNNYGSDYDQSSMNNVSAYEGDLQLSEKLQKYINRIAATCLGQQYAQKYVRSWNQKNARKAKKVLNADADLLAQAELLGQIGFKSTLQKMRYSDQKAPATPIGDKRGKAKASMKVR